MQWYSEKIVYIDERPLQRKEDTVKDEMIIALYLERNETALSETKEKYGNYCFRISYNILHNWEDAEECLNDTWQRAWDSIPPQIPERLSVYLGKITRNLSLNRLKQANAAKRGCGQRDLALAELQECIPDRQRVEQVVEDKRITEVIERFLYDQPSLKRRLFLRRYWYLDSITDLARRFGITESKVMSVLFRMRKELKKQLQKEDICL